MNTPTHAIVNLSLIGKLPLSQFNLPIVIGGIIPDLPIFVFYFWAKFVRKLPESQIWSEAYYQPLCQNAGALFHSIPLAVLGWIIGYYGGWQTMQILYLSLILHSLLDLPVHNSDAHRHFFPFSNYRFISPLSYWDREHYGTIVALIELLLVIIATCNCFSFVQSVVGKGLMLA
ncbi:MAG: hypothetical protein GDA43_10475 [Hormoscilla sp. SP5CHS1]|nr:hypothetical protein [Hormoscilla sp. SP12CHS1]MBC6453579.1 hypothetical protein [Hormoscilla sp. SP5CHS1]